VSRQFSIPTVLRMVPNVLLREFFERLGHDQLDIAWAKHRERDIEPIVKTLSDLEREEQDRIEAALRNVFDLACESGINALLEAAVRCGDLSLPASLPSDVDAYGKAMWAWLNRPEAFEKALLIHQVQHLSWWRKRNDLPIKPPNLGEAARRELEEEVANMLTWEQGRGKVCTVELLSRDDVDYFFAYPDDFAQNVVAHDDDGLLTPRTFRPTFAIVFAYNRREGTLELYAKVPAKLKQKLEIIFAQVILDHQLGTWTPDAAYQLDHLKDPAFPLETDPQDRLKVHIRRMRLSPKNTGRRLQVEMDDDDPQDSIYRTIDECLNREWLDLSQVWVSQVTFCFEFLPLEGRKAGRMSFDIGWPSSCTLRNDRPERVALVQKYLKRWNIDCVRSVACDLAEAGC